MKIIKEYDPTKMTHRVTNRLRIRRSTQSLQHENLEILVQCLLYTSKQKVHATSTEENHHNFHRTSVDETSYNDLILTRDGDVNDVNVIIHHYRSQI